MNLKKQNILKLILIPLSVIAFCYASLWLYYAFEMRKLVERLAVEDKIYFTQDNFGISGFPGFPVMTYAGEVRKGDFKITTPSLKITGFVLPAQPVHIEFPEGFILSDTRNERLFTLDYAALETDIPVPVPKSLKEKDLQAWQEKGGFIKVHNLSLKANGLVFDAQGEASLTSNLQPEFDAKTYLEGFPEFLDYLFIDGYITEQEQRFMNSAYKIVALLKSRPDQKGIHVSLSLKNNMLYIEGVKIAKIPHIHWERDRL